jgi:hypothetical protein
MNEHASSLPVASAPAMQAVLDAVFCAGAFGQVPSEEEDVIKMAAKVNP